MSQHTIIGGGIIGLMSAYYLAQAGRKITLIDRTTIGDASQTSFGNAGVLAIGSVMPIGEPGIIKDGLNMLLSVDSSLSIPWRYRLAIAPWLFQLLRESTRVRHDANAKAIAALNSLSNQHWRLLIEKLGLQTEFHDTGWLKVFETDAAADAMTSQKPYLEAAGLGLQQLTADEVYQLEPSLSRHFKHGFLQTQAQSIRQPSRLLKRLQNKLVELGVNFVKADVSQITHQKSGYRVEGQGFEHQCSALTVCGGAWSKRLLKPLGVRVPLETERGYHLMFDAQTELSRSVMNIEKQIVLTQMDDGLRMTSGVELAGLDGPPDFDWARRKVAIAQRMLPDTLFNEQSCWLGFRPSIPDSNPVISLHPTLPNLSLAFGHGHLGMTQAAGTGKLLAQLVVGEQTDIQTSPYSVSRF